MKKIILPEEKKFSEIQNKIFEFLLKKLNQKNINRPLNFKISKILKISGLGEKDIEQLRNETLGMIIGVEAKKNEKFYSFHLFHKIKYKTNGKVEFEFHQDFLQLFI